jgi:hypothetical protein
MVAAGLCNSLGNELVASVANQAIIPDRVAQFDARPGDTNTGDIYYTDRTTGGTGVILGNMSKRSTNNTICLKDYFFSDATGGDKVIIEIESK